MLAAAASAVRVEARGTTFTCRLDGELAEDELRGAAVTRAVSRVARMPGVRGWVNAAVRELARSHDIVVDGRDIGTVVFPDAALKIFLIADSWERARRRLTQRLGRGPTEAEIAVETEELVRRDAQDATQTVQAPDAILIDTTYLTQREQVERIVALTHAVQRGSRLAAPGRGKATGRLSSGPRATERNRPAGRHFGR